MPDSGKILVQRQASGDLEMIVGLVRDPQLGPCVMVGLGGVMAEILNDPVFGMAPLSRSDAMGMIGRLENQRLLDGFRGAPPVDRGALADILARLGMIGDSLPEVKEVDVNPLIIQGGLPVAVDAAIVIAG